MQTATVTESTLLKTLENKKTTWAQISELNDLLKNRSEKRDHFMENLSHGDFLGTYFTDEKDLISFYRGHIHPMMTIGAIQDLYNKLFEKKDPDSPEVYKIINYLLKTYMYKKDYFSFRMSILDAFSKSSNPATFRLKMEPILIKRKSSLNAILRFKVAEMLATGISTNKKHFVARSFATRALGACIQLGWYITPYEKSSFDHRLSKLEKFFETIHGSQYADFNAMRMAVFIGLQSTYTN